VIRTVFSCVLYGSETNLKIKQTPESSVYLQSVSELKDFAGMLLILPEPAP